MENTGPGRRAAGLLSLLVIYFVWGSTYLAIRVAVREEGGFPPFFLGATRLFAASLILLCWIRLRRMQIRLSRREFMITAVSGLALWVGGNGMVNWAEQHAASGYAALVIGSTPIFTCLMEAALDRRWPGARLLAPVLIGFAGLAVLSWPVVRAGDAADCLSTAALLAATLSWGGGSVYLSRRALNVPSLVGSFYQQLVGGLGFLLFALLAGEPAPTPTVEALLAWAYLVVFGSLVAFTLYLVALRNLPVAVVMTYAYVNPVLAVALGWLLLNESLSWWTAAGTALILLGVAGVFREKYGKNSASSISS